MRLRPGFLAQAAHLELVGDRRMVAPQCREVVA
jgi:hypothetical protein